MGGRHRLGILRFASGWKSPILLYPVNMFVPPEMWRERRVQEPCFSFCSSHSEIATKGSALNPHGSQPIPGVTLLFPKCPEPRLVYG